MIKLKKILLENPDANKDDLFGEYLFGNYRRDYPASEEKDTVQEKELAYALANHFNYGAYNETLYSFLPIIFDLIKKGKYLNFLKPDEEYEYAYRLIQKIGLEQAHEYFNIDFKQYLKRKIAYGVIDKNIIYQPKARQNNMSSWTLLPQKDIFNSILNSSADIKSDYEAYVFMFLRAKIKDNNFILNPEQMQNKTNLVRVDEFEVLSHGNVNVDRISFFIIDKNNTSEFGTEYTYGNEKVLEYETIDILNKLIKLIK
jgi:hypothetical protein